ncbi:MAG: efflux RND transporter periplasmic adaptor subunit [Burkholderiaceae bacterium]
MFSPNPLAPSITTPARRHKPLAWLGALVLTGLLAGCEQPPPPADVVRVVRTMQVSDQSGRNQMELAADVRARTEIQLAFRVGGKLIERDAEVGQVVEPGQVLARLDPNDLRSAVAAADAQVQAAAVQRRQAQADLGRFEQLRSQGFISDAEMERHQAAFDGADAQYRQAMAQKQVQANQAGYAQLAADTEGIVVSVEAEVGAVLAAGRPVVRLARNGERDVVFVVPEDQRDWVLALRDKQTPLPVALWGSERALSALDS